VYNIRNKIHENK